MATGTRAAEVTRCFRSMITRLASICGAGADTMASTYTLYRRRLNDPTAPVRDDLGLQVRPTIQEFKPVVENEPCIFVGTNPKSERWQVYAEGQVQVELVTLYTSFQDIREGDNLLLAYDGKFYLVEASTYAGPLRRCFLNSAKAQMA